MRSLSEVEDGHWRSPKNIVMAALAGFAKATPRQMSLACHAEAKRRREAATQQARVGARSRRFRRSQTRPHWVAASRAAMTVGGWLPALQAQIGEY